MYENLENEVDGEAFLLLSDEQIKSLIKPMGVQIKLIARRKSLLSKVCYF